MGLINIDLKKIRVPMKTNKRGFFKLFSESLWRPVNVVFSEGLSITDETTF